MKKVVIDGYKTVGSQERIKSSERMSDLYFDKKDNYGRYSSHERDLLKVKIESEKRVSSTD